MKALYVAKRDLVSYLHGMWGWVIITAILILDGLLFNLLALTEGERLSHEVLEQFFFNTTGATIAAAVLLTMRSFAEEKQTGTDVILETSPISDGQIVFGKWLAAMGMLTLLTLLTAYMPALIFVNGKVAIGHIVVGYIGMLSVAGATAALGIFASSLVRSQVVAGVIGAALTVVLLITWYLARQTEPPFTGVIEGMALFENFMPFLEGRLLTSKLVYYASVAFGALFLTTRMLETRRWK